MLICNLLGCQQKVRVRSQIFSQPLQPATVECNESVRYCSGDCDDDLGADKLAFTAARRLKSMGTRPPAKFRSCVRHSDTSKCRPNPVLAIRSYPRHDAVGPEWSFEVISMLPRGNTRQHTEHASSRMRNACTKARLPSSAASCRCIPRPPGRRVLSCLSPSIRRRTTPGTPHPRQP